MPVRIQLAGFALAFQPTNMMRTASHGRDCERNVGAGERYENEGLAPEQGAVRCRTSERLGAPLASAVGEWSHGDGARRRRSRQGGEKKHGLP